MEKIREWKFFLKNTVVNISIYKASEQVSFYPGVARAMENKYLDNGSTFFMVMKLDTTNFAFFSLSFSNLK